MMSRSCVSFYDFSLLICFQLCFFLQDFDGALQGGWLCAYVVLDSLESTWILTPCTLLPASLAVKSSVAVSPDRWDSVVEEKALPSSPLIPRHTHTLGLWTCLCVMKHVVSLSRFCTGYLSVAPPTRASRAAHHRFAMSYLKHE